MYEIYNLNTDAMRAEVDYRRNQLIGDRSALGPRARWWRRRETTTR